MFDLARETLLYKANIFQRPRGRLRKARREFRESNVDYEKFLQAMENIEKRIAAVRDHKQVEDSDVMTKEIESLFEEWQKVLEHLVDIEKTEVMVEYLTVHPLDEVAAWLTHIKEELQRVQQVISQKFAGQPNQQQLERVFQDLVNKYEVAHKGFIHMYSEELNQLGKAYKVILAEDKGGMDSITELRQWVGAVDTRMKASDLLYKERGEIRSVAQALKKVVQLETKTVKDFEKMINKSDTASLQESGNLMKQVDDAIEDLKQDFVRMLKDFLTTIILIAHLTAQFKQKGEVLVNQTLELLKESQIDEHHMTEMTKKATDIKDKVQHLPDSLTNIVRRFARKEQQDNDLARAA